MWLVINKVDIWTYVLTIFLAASADFLWWLINYIMILLSDSTLATIC
jgi:hypothetical protein